MINKLKYVDKKTINRISISMFLFSCFFIYIAVSNSSKPSDLVGETSIISNILNDCKTAAYKLDFKNVSVLKETNGGVIKISENKIEDPMDAIYKSSLLKSECNKLIFVDYCMGNNCGTNELSITFRLKQK